jgi:DNA-binding NarL/FixJ family response regulator
MPIRVAIVEDDPLTRKGLVMHINRASNLQCVGCYENAEDAEREIPQVLPDVVLMDINLHGRSGIACVDKLKQTHPQIQFLILTTYDDSELIFAALRAGADGYLLKRTRPAQLLKAIEEVRGGGLPMSSNIARLLVTHFHQTQQPVNDMQKLMRREREVLDQLAKGLGYGEVAEHLGISMGTMNSHVEAIYRKLHMQTGRGGAQATAPVDAPPCQ